MQKMMKALMAGGEYKPRPGYKPTAREERDKRALLGSNIFYNPTLELVEIPVPEPKDDEILLKVGGAAVCGSDTNFLGADEDNYSHYAGHCKLPCVIGHEFSGEVAAVGKNVKELKVGDLVVAETMAWCGECLACRRGQFNQCENLEEIGFSVNGAYAEYLVAKEKLCFKVDGLVKVYGDKRRALEVASMIEPMAVAYNGVFTRGGGIEPGGHVVVFGCGPIGLSAISLLKTSGAAKIIAFDPNKTRQALARDVGATDTFDPFEYWNKGEKVSDLVMELTKGVGAAMVVEATHEPGENIPEAVDMLASFGTIAQIGITANTVDFHPVYMQKKGANYHFAIGSSGHGTWPNVIRLIEAGRVDPSRYLSKCYHLEDAIEAIQAAAKAEGGKFVVTPNW